MALLSLGPLHSCGATLLFKLPGILPVTLSILCAVCHGEAAVVHSIHRHIGEQASDRLAHSLPDTQQSSATLLGCNLTLDTQPLVFRSPSGHRKQLSNAHLSVRDQQQVLSGMSVSSCLHQRCRTVKRQACQLMQTCTRRWAWMWQAEVLLPGRCPPVWLPHIVCAHPCRSLGRMGTQCLQSC